MVRVTRARMLVLAAIVLAALAAAAAGWIVRRGYSARRPPSAAEEMVARRLRSLATPSSARDRRNPVARTPEVLARARDHYADHCAVCHDHDGSGRTEIGRGMYPPPPDMRARPTQDLTDGELHYVIENGIRFTGMPGFGAADGGTGTWELVHFIRHLPVATLAEIEAMRRPPPPPATPASPDAPTPPANELSIEDDFLAGGDRYLRESLAGD